MAKKGFPSKEAAEDAIRYLGRYGIDKIPYQYIDPVTGDRKWFIRRAPRKRNMPDNGRQEGLNNTKPR